MPVSQVSDLLQWLSLLGEIGRRPEAGRLRRLSTNRLYKDTPGEIPAQTQSAFTDFADHRLVVANDFDGLALEKAEFPEPLRIAIRTANRPDPHFFARCSYSQWKHVS